MESTLSESDRVGGVNSRGGFGRSLVREDAGAGLTVLGDGDT